MRRIFLLAGYCLIVLQVKPQDTVRLSLSEAIKMAETNYPKLKAYRYELEVSKANIKLQEQAIIPHLDAAYQMNIATANNITGMFYPQFVLPMTGPPSSGNDYSPVTGSAASLLFQWQPGAFGDRRSKISLAAVSLQTLQAKNDQEIFAHKVNVSSQYLEAVYFQQLLKISEENIHISESQLRQVKVLAKTGLRPGVDTALIQAELSRTRIEWLKIKNLFNTVLSSLRQSVASDAAIISKDTAFYSLIPNGLLADTSEHPTGKTARLSIEEDKIKRTVIGKLTAPHVSFWGATYARGSGINYNGVMKTFDGFNLNRFNYGAGIQLAVPLLNHAEVKTRLKQQDWLIKSGEEKMNQVSLELREQRKLSESTFFNAVSIVKETPVQVYSAEYAFNAMQIRYNTGLVNYAELLQTQAGLLKAKIELARSRAELWKALLYKAAVYGDLNLFINQVK